MAENSPQPITLDELVEMSDIIVMARWDGNDHGAFPPRDAFDGTSFLATEILWQVEADMLTVTHISLANEYTAYPFYVGPFYSNNPPDIAPPGDPRTLSRIYPSSLPEAGIQGEMILFLVGHDKKKPKHLTCRNAWESADKKPDVVAAIRRIRK